jgi:hypothetical protein
VEAKSIIGFGLTRLLGFDLFPGIKAINRSGSTAPATATPTRESDIFAEAGQTVSLMWPIGQTVAKIIEVLQPGRL